MDREGLDGGVCRGRGAVGRRAGPVAGMESLLRVPSKVQQECIGGTVQTAAKAPIVTNRTGCKEKRSHWSVH